MTSQDEFRLAWSTAYWDARDSGLGSDQALRVADDATLDLLDTLEDA